MYQVDNTQIDETLDVIANLQENFAKEKDTDPINIWVKQKDIIDAQPDLKPGTVKMRLKRLVESDKCHYSKESGYQSKKFDNIHDF